MPAIRRAACWKAFMSRLKRGDEVVQGDVDGTIRLALVARLAVRFRSRRRAGEFRRDQSAQAPGARPHRRAGRLYSRAQAPCSGVRDRPRRHRQDLACGRACRAAVRAQGGRPHRAVAAGGGGRRAARLPARRHARKGRSLSAADLRRAVRPDGCAHRRARFADHRNRNRAAGLHARPHAVECRESFSTRRRTPPRCR